MKRKNYLNVFTIGYLTWRYIPNWWANIKQFFRNIKYAYQRATKGYCDYDLWSLDMYYAQLFNNSLNELAKISHGWPGDINTLEDWQDYLHETAEHFYNTIEDNEDVQINVQCNDMHKLMQEQIKEINFIKAKDGAYEMVYEYNDKDKYDAFKEEWLKLEKESYDFRIAEKNKGFDMMKERFFDLWD